MEQKQDKKPRSRHLFSKAVVIYCVIFVSVASLWALGIASRTGVQTEQLLMVIVGFFGGELMMLCLKRIVGEPKEPKES